MTISVADYSEFLETIPDPAILVNRDGEFVSVNAQTKQLFGYQDTDMIGQRLNILLPASISKTHDKMFNAYFKAPSMRPMGSNMDIQGRHASGKEFPIDIMLRPVVIADETYAVCVMRDITKFKEQEAFLARALSREHELAITDYLTGIANARAFHTALETEIQRLARYQHPFTLAFIDLDNFKAVNDIQGHDQGDQVLITVATYLQEHLRNTDVSGRLGGDEFAVLLAETPLDTAKEVLSKLHSHLNAAMQEKGWPVTFSIGALTCYDGVEKASSLIKIADNLMYDVKKSGKNNIKYATHQAEKTTES